MIITPQSHDEPRTDRSPRFSRRLRIELVLAALILLVGGAAWWIDSGEDHGYAAQERAVAELTAAAADFRLPASVAPMRCESSATVCGTTSSDVTSLLRDLASSLDAIGASLRETTDCTDGYPATQCGAVVLFDGAAAGLVMVDLDSAARAAFGRPSYVDLTLGRPTVGRSSTAPLPQDPAALGFLPAQLEDRARCASRSPQGCLRYDASRDLATSRATRRELWADAGRRLVRNGWRVGRATCDERRCMISATRARTPFDPQPLLGVVSFVPLGDGVRVKAIVSGVGAS